MKFRDIKPFIRDGGYQIDVSLLLLESVIDDFTSSYGLELNPDFQRGHVWTEDQQVKFVEFILRNGRTNPVYLNMPSWQGLATTDYDDFVCVDGLQRLTAMLRFARNEIKVFGTLFNDFEDRPAMLTGGIKVNVNSLKTKKEVLRWYVQLNDGGTPHTKEEINKVKSMIEETK